MEQWRKAVTVQRETMNEREFRWMVVEAAYSMNEWEIDQISACYR